MYIFPEDRFFVYTHDATRQAVDETSKIKNHSHLIKQFQNPHFFIIVTCFNSKAFSYILKHC